MRFVRVNRGPAGQRSGFVIVAMILVMTVMAGALVVMSSAFAHQMKRTRATVAAGQLRQFLLAGEASAEMELNTHGSGAREIEIQTPVNDAKLILQITPSNEGEASVSIRANYRTYRSSQVVQFKRGANSQWTMQEAHLLTTSAF